MPSLTEDPSLVLLGASLLASLVFGGIELAILPAAVREGLGFWSFTGQLAPCLVGNLIPYALVVACVLLGLRLLGARVRRRWLGIWGPSFGLTLLLSPYFFQVADFAFSGSQASTLPQRPLYVGSGFAALALGFWAYLALFIWRSFHSPSYWVSGVAWLLTLGLLTTSHLVLPNEYEALHALLARLALILAVHGGFEAARAFPSRRRVEKFRLPLSGSLLVFGLFSTWVLSTSEVLAWPIWSETAGSRYLTERWGSGEGEIVESMPSDEKWERPTLGDAVEEAAHRKARRVKRAPHIMVFSIDNLQADRVGAYGYAKNPTTPNIDRLARQGAIFRRAYTLYPGTRIFMCSMLSGRRIPAMGRHYLPEQFQRESLTRMLKQRDYHTLVKGVFELTAYRDFDPTDYAIDTNLHRETVKEIRESKTIPHIPLEKRFALIDEHFREAADQEKPVFLWIHLLGPHRFRGGFVGSEDFSFGSSLSDKYDSTIAGTEAWLAELEALVKEHLSPDGREVLWVIQSDHGAGMTRASRRETGKTLYEDQVRVPLILSGAGIEPGVHDILVDSAVDMSATLLDLVGITPPHGYDGVSLVPYLQGRADAHEFSDRLLPLREGESRGAVLGDFKYIGRGKSHSLFDLARDPRERRNLADTNPKKLKEVRRRALLELKRQETAFAAAKLAD